MSLAPAEDLYETGDVAHLFGVSTSLVHRWRKQGKVTPLRTRGGRYLYTAAHLATLREMRASRPVGKRAQRLGVAGS